MATIKKLSENQKSNQDNSKKIHALTINKFQKQIPKQIKTEIYEVTIRKLRKPGQVKENPCGEHRETKKTNKKKNKNL